MSSPAEAADAVETALDLAWNDATPIAWGNAPFTPPTTGSWLKVDWLWGNGTVTTKSSGGLNSVVGVLQLAIFSPKNKGDVDGDAYSDVVRAIFNRVRMDEVWFGAASGPVKLEEESWRQTVVSVPFRVLETVT